MRNRQTKFQLIFLNKRETRIIEGTPKTGKRNRVRNVQISQFAWLYQRNNHDQSLAVTGYSRHLPQCKGSHLTAGSPAGA